MAQVLIATDDTRLYEVLQAEVEGLGHQALWAVTGQEAVETAQEARPALVLLDTRIELFDAYETCALMRDDPDLPERLPVLFVSDEDISVRKLERVKATGRLGRTHAAHEVQELLSQHAT